MHGPRAPITSPEDISRLSYPDFIAFLRQENTPPGGEFSVRAWIKKGEIGSGSHVLDLACSTGFSSRFVASLTGCSGEGIDISSDAISVAMEALQEGGTPHRLRYKVADASSLPFGADTFTHILAGCNFSFIQKREQALLECKRVLICGGKLCVANFFYAKEPDQALLSEVERVVGFRPQAHWTESFWNQFFDQHFSKTWELQGKLPTSSEEALTEAIQDYIYNENVFLRNSLAGVRDACFSRLLETRRILNNHRFYQQFVVQIWQKSQM